MKYVDNVMEVKKDGITVANLRRTDIQKVSKYDYSDWQDSENGTVYFGSSNSTYSNPKYPEMWAQYDSKWTYGYDGTTETGSDKECEMWEKENGDGNMTGKGEGSSNTTFKQSHYEHDFADCKDQFINETYYDLLFNDPDSGDPFKKYYWIASRYVHLNVEKCVFGLESVGAYSAVHRISRSRPIRVGSVYRLRPVVIFAP